MKKSRKEPSFLVSDGFLANETLKPFLFVETSTAVVNIHLN